MSYRTLELDSGWQLGWYPDPVSGRWGIRCGDWKIENGHLFGWGGFSYIYSNYIAEPDYTFACDVTFTEPGNIVFGLKYHLQRLSYYGFSVSPGQKDATLDYVYSGGVERVIRRGIDVDPAATAVGQTFRFSYTVSGDRVSVFVNGKEAVSFDADSLDGRMSMLLVRGGRVQIDRVSITENDTGAVLFSEGFETDSLARHPEVKLEELDAVAEWIPAVVPGSVQTALLRAGRIEDPYYGYNGPKQMWIDRQRWVYKKTFTVPDEMRTHLLRLEFGGVDYHGWFWLNGQCLGYHEGMFGGPDCNVTDLIRYESEGENELVVCLLPVPDHPFTNVRPYIFHRWHFNMDILPLGLWRGVRLVAEKNVFLADPQVVTRKIENGTAAVDLSVSVNNLAIWPLDIKVSFSLTSPDPADAPVTVEVPTGYFHGCQRVETTLEVPNARLWWPNGMGPQNRYDVTMTVEMFKRGEHIGHDTLTFKTGLRTFKMLPSTNKTMPVWRFGNVPRSGSLYNWVMTVNDVPFYGKGSNWMPVDQMYDLRRDRYELLLGRARDCNINILRPWGAGLIETDDFYDVCDEYGIMVWQEMLMANGYYASTDIEVWRDTVTRSAKRIRNHPSLAIWCGGNEFDPDCEPNRAIVDEMEAILYEYDPSREFHRACPYGGDSHSYQVNWMEGAYYTYFNRDRSLAVTEYSMASPPSLDTIRRLVPEEEMKKWPPDLPDQIDRYDYPEWGENVQRRDSGFSMHDAHLSSITNVMFPAMSDCGIPKNWEEFTRFMQTAHGLLTQFGTDCWRSRFPDCTMSMSWVFNVVFPDTMSWSYIDYYGIPKRSYWYKKHAYEPLHVTAVFDDLFTPAGSAFKARLSVINETGESYRGAAVRVRLYDHTLWQVARYEKQLDILPHDVVKVGHFDYDIPADAEDNVMFLCVDLAAPDGRILSRSVYCPRIGTPTTKMPYLKNGPWISDVKLFPAMLEVESRPAEAPAGEGEARLVRIANTGSLPAFQVTLQSPGNEEFMTYSDNCFWLEPFETREILVSSKKALGPVTVDAWNSDPIPAM